MRHRKRTVKLGRTSSHRDAMLASLVCSLIEHRRIETTLAKAKAARVVAEKAVTLAKKGVDNIPAQRRAVSKLRSKDAVFTLFHEIAPTFADRQGGYTRIYKLGPRKSDGAEMALLEWVGLTFEVEDEDEEFATTED